MMRKFWVKPAVNLKYDIYQGHRAVHISQTRRPLSIRPSVDRDITFAYYFSVLAVIRLCRSFELSDNSILSH